MSVLEFFSANNLKEMRVVQNRLMILVLSAQCVLLTACATATKPLPETAAVRQNDVKNRQQKQLDFRLASGVYRCDLGQKIEIQRDAHNASRIDLDWQGNRYTLLRHDSTSGLPRYEDRTNGLLWIDLPWKSILIDSNSERPLANECKATGS